MASAAVAATLALGAVAAYGYYTSTGSGSGTGATGSASTLTLAGNAVSGLEPGAAAVPLTGTVTNPGTGDELLNVVTPTFGSSPCGLQAYDFTFSPSPTLALTIAGGASLTNVSFGSVRMNDLATPQSQSCSFTITYSSN
jgi:hypothetical protein